MYSSNVETENRGVERVARRVCSVGAIVVKG